MKKIFISLLFLITLKGFCQEIPKAAPGTYQLIVKNEKMPLALADEVFQQIENLRDSKVDKRVVLNEQLEVFIPSKKTISASGFKPLIEIIYE